MGNDQKYKLVAFSVDDVFTKLTNVFNVSLDYLVGTTNVNIDQSLLDKVLSIQSLPDEDKEHIQYAIDALIQHAKTRMAYKK